MQTREEFKAMVNRFCDEWYDQIYANMPSTVNCRCDVIPCEDDYPKFEIGEWAELASSVESKSRICKKGDRIQVKKIIIWATGKREYRCSDIRNQLICLGRLDLIKCGQPKHLIGETVFTGQNKNHFMVTAIKWDRGLKEYAYSQDTLRFYTESSLISKLDYYITVHGDYKIIVYGTDKKYNGDLLVKWVHRNGCRGAYIIKTSEISSIVSPIYELHQPPIDHMHDYIKNIPVWPHESNQGNYQFPTWEDETCPEESTKQFCSAICQPTLRSDIHRQAQR